MLVGDIVRLFGYQLPERIQVTFDAEDRTCALPRDTIRQVLINLLRNSSEAIGEKPGTIRVDMHRENSHSILTVSDDGPGYPEALLSHGIRPFQTGKSGGTGLGLSVIQRLVHSAGGDIKLACAEGGGAQTTVILPCGDE